MSLKEMGEFGLINELTKELSPPAGGLLVGVGDDAAVLSHEAGRAFVATCDSQVEGVHFRLGQIPLRSLGRRLASVNLSDIAAMGARPRFALISIIVPENMEMESLKDIYAGCRENLQKAGACLVGGNTCRSPRDLVLDMTLLGEVEPAKALLRSGARSGDVVCVTGELGASRAGLFWLENQDASFAKGFDAAPLLERHFEPRARISEGVYLSESGKISSCLDVSDGVLGDAGHLAKRSGVKVVIDIDALPISRVTRQFAFAAGKDPREWALRGGEDFELMFTVSPKDSREVIEGVGAKTGLRVTPIGRVLKGEAVVVIEKDGEEMEDIGGAFDHFRR